jgi:hypothetical protein
MEAWISFGADFVPNHQAGMRMIVIKLLSQERHLTARGVLRIVLIVKERGEEALQLEGLDPILSCTEKSIHRPI